jgi:DMSO/TMAO reductase YedYZ molybdopterin-dependent catalytic subunit
VAGLIGALEALRHLGGSGVDVTGGAAQSVQNMFSSFPINAVEHIPTRTWSDWTLKVNGLVDRPLTLDAAGWQALPRFDETADFHCVEGWSVSGVRWGGVTPATILKQAKARPEGSYLVFHAYTGEYVDSLPIDLALDPQTVLADTMDGAPLPAKHGGPLRLIVPKQLGYKSVKWVTRIEVTDKPVQGFWEQRGYPSNAPI